MANRKSNNPKTHYTLRLTQFAQAFCEEQSKRFGFKSGRVWAQDHIEKMAADERYATKDERELIRQAQNEPKQ